MAHNHPGGMPFFPGPPELHPDENQHVRVYEKGDALKDRDARGTAKPLSNAQQEIRNLNQYTGYFTTPEGDFPVSVVANSIKEAAKILTMPGVFGEGVEEPAIIKFIKGKIAVSVPVHVTGFNVVIEPAGAEESGAYATPVHAEVKNGTEVIFTAHEPFGWKFVGWYKGEQLLSTKKVSVLEVYDPYSTLLVYTAKYEFEPILRNGRYLDLNNGYYFDFKFDKWSNYEGKLIIHSNKHQFEDWHLVISDYTPASGDLVTQIDPTITQSNEGGFTAVLTPTPIGISLVMQTSVTEDNPYGFVTDQVINLKWMHPLKDY